MNRINFDKAMIDKSWISKRMKNCLRACLEISDEALESGVIQEMVSFIKYLKSAEPSLEDSFTVKSILAKLEKK